MRNSTQASIVHTNPDILGTGTFLTPIRLDGAFQSGEKMRFR